MLTVIALSVLLQDPPPPPPPPEVRSHFVFVGGDGPQGPGRLDADGDGQVTREEFGAPLNTAFARMDKDGDGRLSDEELASGHGPGFGEGEVTIVRTPGDGEGRRIEFRRSGEGSARIEGDGGRVMIFTGGGPGARSEREIVVRSGRGEPRVIHLEGDDVDGPRESRVEVRRFGGPEGGDGHDLDKDGDGKVSEAEFTAPLREAFTRMDADRSGFIEDGERGGDGEVRVFTHRIERRDGGE